MRFRLLSSALASLSLALSGVAVPAQAQDNSNQLKAALIYNILRFVDLGVSAGGTIDLCIWRNVPARGEIRSLNRRTLTNRTISVRDIDNGDLTGCDVVYLGGVSASEIRRSQGSGRTLIGDGSGFVSSGGTIGFVRMGNQVRFEINIGSARESGVEISSKLLRLASRIVQ